MTLCKLRKRLSSHWPDPQMLAWGWRRAWTRQRRGGGKRGRRAHPALLLHLGGAREWKKETEALGDAPGGCRNGDTVGGRRAPWRPLLLLWFAEDEFCPDPGFLEFQVLETEIIKMCPQVQVS